MHFHSWRRGLKTGMYYLRTQPAADAIKFTLGAKQGAGAEPGAEQSASERVVRVRQRRQRLRGVR